MRRVALAALLGLVGGCLHYHAGPLPGEPADATFAKVEGARVHYVDEGKGPAVVLVHGFASSLKTWDGVRESLRDDHRVLSLDLKGFGWTDRPPGDYSPLTQARMVFALMDERGIEKASVVGHSWGSSVVLAMALEQPERVERIALYDAWVFEEQLPAMFLWARAKGMGEALFAMFYRQKSDEKLDTAYYDPTIIDQDYIDALDKAQKQPGTTAAALAAVRGQQFGLYQDRYARIRQPVLLLWGKDDRIALLGDGERLASVLPNAQLQVYPRCGHFPMREAKAASTRDLEEFLDRR